MIRTFNKCKPLLKCCYSFSTVRSSVNVTNGLCVNRANNFEWRGQCQRNFSSKQKLKEITSKTSEKVMSLYDTILLDCDGVLWQLDDKTAIAGIPETIEKLRKCSKQLVFVTNNSVLGRDEFANKFKQHGFTASEEDIFTTCYTGAYHLKHIAKIQGAVYAIGTSGMEYELKQLGLKYYGIGPETDLPSRDNDALLNMTFHDDVGGVLVGFDEYFNYVKMYKAASYLTDESCPFVGTCNLVKGKKFSPTLRQPITAAVVEAVAAASRRRPVMMNKPHIHLFNCIKTKYPHVSKARTLFIGDSVFADIGFAKTVGIDSALVLTGASNMDTVRENPGLEPTYVLKSLSVLGCV